MSDRIPSPSHPHNHFGGYGPGCGPKCPANSAYVAPEPVEEDIQPPYDIDEGPAEGTQGDNGIGAWRSNLPGANEEQLPPWTLGVPKVVGGAEMIDLTPSGEMLLAALDTLSKASELKRSAAAGHHETIRSLAILAAAQLQAFDSIRGVEQDKADTYNLKLEQFFGDVENAVTNWTAGRPDGLTEFTTFYNHIQRLVQAVNNSHG